LAGARGQEELREEHANGESLVAAASGVLQRPGKEMMDSAGYEAYRKLDGC
jgi:hypothetical protein